MTTNNKISNIISSQVPFFVRNDHPNFVAFLEAYYEWMEQNGKTIDVAKNIGKYFDADESVGVFLQELEKTFLALIPKEAIVDKQLLLKHVKDFYRARGTEKSVRFLMRILFGEDANFTDFYYPKVDILRASDGKWYVEQTLRFTKLYIDDELIDDLKIIDLVLENTKITGSISGATAIVERADAYYDGQLLVKELIISNRYKNFVSGELITGQYNDGNTVRSLRAEIFSGIINKVRILNGGSGYTAGTTIPLEEETGTGAILQISSVSPGNIISVLVGEGGSGYQVNNSILFSGETGSGANAIVTVVTDNGYYHPNSYSIINSAILEEANTNIANSIINSIYESFAYQNLAIQYVYLSPNTSNLTISSGGITKINLSGNIVSSFTDATSSNVSISNNSIIQIGGQKAVIVSNTSNSVVVYQPLSGNLIGKSISLITGANTSNLYANTGIGNTVNTINLLHLILTLNTSNITLNTGTGNTVNTIKLNSWAGNSNIYFNVGYTLNVNNTNVIVTSYNASSNTINVSPAVSGNLISNTLLIYKKSYVDAWLANSNVAISLFINVGNSNTCIVTSSPTSHVLTVYPKISGNIVANTVFVSANNITVSNLTVKQAYADTITLSNTPANSNVVFFYGDKLNVKSNVITITSINELSTSILGSPGLPGYINNEIIIVERTPFNAYSNLTVNTGAGGSVTTINLSGWISNSNVYFETYDSINVENYVVLITSSNIKSNVITVNPGLPGAFSQKPFSVIKRANANTTIANAMTYFAYGNTGPVKTITTIAGGNGYIVIPSVSIVANSRIRELGILGRMKINDGGTNYTIGDIIEFTPGLQFRGLGSGANAAVSNVDANGTITEVKFTANTGYPIGGTGYSQDFLPSTNVRTSTGSGADISVTSLLGYGGEFTAVSGKIGSIQRITIVSSGEGYEEPPILKLSGLGDGKAQANVTVITGVYSYPGRFINDDGILSSYNFLQDRDYYQNFSYVIKLKKSINDYRTYIKRLIHPAGMKLFGEYLIEDDQLETNTSFQSVNTSQYILLSNSYVSVGNSNTTTNVSNLILSTSGISYISNLSANINTSNVTFKKNTMIQIAGQTTFVKVATNNSITILPALSGNLIGKNIIVFQGNTSNLTYNTNSGNSVNTIILNQWAGNSNISFSVGSLLNVSGNTITVVSYNAKSNIIYVKPNVSGRITLNSLSIVDGTINITSNIKVGIANADIFLYTVRSNNIPFIANLSNDIITSNINFAVNSVIQIAGQTAIIVANTSNTINVLPSMYGNLVRQNVIILSANTSNIRFNTGIGTAQSYITLTRWAGNSNIKFGAGFVLNIHNKPVFVKSYNKNSNLVGITPPVSGNIISNTLTIFDGTINITSNIWVGIADEEYIYTQSAPANSNVTIKIGDRIVDPNVTVIAFTDDSKNIIVNPPFDGYINNKSISINKTFYFSNIAVYSRANTANLSDVYIEFLDSTGNNMINLSNGIYTAYPNTFNYNSFFISTANAVNATGNVMFSIY